MRTIQSVLTFWFETSKAEQWFQKNAEFDQNIKNLFLEVHQQAIQSELWQWRETAEGRLAEIIVLDQFSRNIYRDLPEAFSADPLALALAQECIARDLDKSLSIEKRAFIYMPFMHSESKLIHAEAVKLFQTPGLEHHLDFELKHKAIIDRFGRYPHRNAILSRESTEAELAFLREPGSSF